jgi:hypothetical protein
MDWSQIFQLVGALGKTGAGVYSAFQKQPLPPGFAEASQAASNANTYAQASLDPSSPYFRNIAEGEEQRLRGDLVTSIQEIIRANLARQGKGAFVNPERRDETVWRALTQGFRDAGMRARELARSRLMELSGASRGQAAAYAPMMQYGFLNQAINRGNQAAGIGGAFDAISRTGDLFKKPGTKEHGAASTPDDYKFGQATARWW